MYFQIELQYWLIAKNRLALKLIFRATFFSLGAKFAIVNNRILLGVCLVFTLFGALLLGDWQSIVNEDPCHLSISPDCFNNSTANGVDWNSSLPLLGEGGSLAIDPANCSNTLAHYLSYSERYVDNCESLSTDGNSCYWNQQSDITGEFCNTCLPACLSRQANMNFYQFTAGVMFLSIAAPLGYVFISAVASEITPVESQVS